MDCRTTEAQKFRTRVGFKHYDVILEQLVLTKINSLFERLHGYTFISQVTKPIFKSIPEHSEHYFLSNNFPSYMFTNSFIFQYFSVTSTNLFLLLFLFCFSV